MDPIAVALLLSPVGPSSAEVWMGEARLAAARDLLDRLHRLPMAGPVFVLAADPGDQEDLAARGAKPVRGPPGEFHFGRALAAIVQEEGLADLAYFGGASAPLANEDFLGESFEAARRGRVVVNNYHSTDWAVVPQAGTLVGLADRLASDNALGWVLDHDGKRQVTSMPEAAASRADIDTPSDLAMIARHSSLGPQLRQMASRLPEALSARVDRLRGVLGKPGTTLALIGRASSGVWQALEARTQVWVRVFSEERGMIASGRMERGEVRSLIGTLVDQAGPRAFVDALASMSDGVIWDTRVWMAHRGPWPSAADRFASDLGLPDGIEGDSLRGLTAAVAGARLPVVLGGHGVVAGGLLALLESLDPNGHGPEPAGG